MKEIASIRDDISIGDAMEAFCWHITLLKEKFNHEQFEQIKEQVQTAFRDIQGDVEQIHLLNARVEAIKENAVQSLSGTFLETLEERNKRFAQEQEEERKRNIEEEEDLELYREFDFMLMCELIKLHDLRKRAAHARLAKKRKQRSVSQR